MVLCLFASPVIALQNKPVPLGARLKLRWDEKTVTIFEGRQKHVIELRDNVNAFVLGSVKLQSAKEKDGFIYLLFDVTGPSRSRQAVASGYCGAGEESNLIWVKLQSDWNLEKAQSFLYESCLESREISDRPAWDGNTLEIKSTDYRKNIDTIARYSLKAPEAGLEIVSGPMKN